MIEIVECEQNTPEWLRARMGMVTCSEMKTIIGVKKDARDKVTRQNYLLRLAGEIICDEPFTDGYKNATMDRGHTMEDEARSFYALMRSETDEIRRVGFVKNGKAGWSPDSLIGKSGSLEIKTAFPHILAGLILKDEFPPEHKAQTQGGLLIGELEWVDLQIYWPKMPRFVKRAYRDEPYIKMLDEAVDQFNAELHQTVEMLRRYG